MILTYDTETTGLPARSRAPELDEQPRIVQLGAVLDDASGKEIMRLDVILALDFENLPEKVQKGWVGEDGKGGAAGVHGISPEVSKAYGVNERTAIDLFLDMIEVAELIVGQNIEGFDNFIVTGAARRALGDNTLDPFRGKRIFDTMKAGTPLCKLPKKGGGLRSPSLTALHEHLFGEGFDGAHAAINDVLAARRCFYRMQDIANAAQGKVAA